MTKPDDSADSLMKKHKAVFPMLCKVCHCQFGWNEHKAVNLGMCDPCGIWWNRELFRAAHIDSRIAQANAPPLETEDTGQIVFQTRGSQHDKG
jgi:hypothetical protein